MKPSLTYLKNHLVCFGVAVLLVASVNVAKAQILLINDSNPDDVIITATGFAPSTNASNIFDNGVDLLGFLTASSGFPSGGDLSTSLTTGDSSAGPTFDNWQIDNLSNSNVDLTLYSAAGGSNAETFTLGDAAFRGTMTLDLGALPVAANGSSGTIVTGFNGGGPNTAIGTWQVVNTVSTPEPSTWLMLLVGLASFAILRFRASRR